MSCLPSHDSIEATLRGLHFRKAVVTAGNQQMKLHEPQWDIVDHRVEYASEDRRTGRRKVAVTIIFEDNGLELA
jgi:hypothetical protein